MNRPEAAFTSCALSIRAAFSGGRSGAAHRSLPRRRACEAACPSGVQYGALLEATRDHIESNHARSPFQTFLRRIAIEKVFPFPTRMKLALWPARMAKTLGIERWLPKVAREALSLVPEGANWATLPRTSPAAGTSQRGQVGFVQGCVMSVMFGDTNRASVKLLNRAGYDVVTPGDQVCCGALYAHTGSLERARACARRNIAAVEGLELDAIVTHAAGGGSTLKNAATCSTTTRVGGPAPISSALR